MKRNRICNARPCDNCPFRSDIQFHLPVSRVREILASLMIGQHFDCHKTTEFDDDGNVVHSSKTLQCAGSVILLEHAGKPNQMMRIGERIGMYDMREMEMDSPVFHSRQEMIKEYQKRNLEKDLGA